MPNEACFLYIMKGKYESVSAAEKVKLEAEESLLMKCGNYTIRMLPSKSSETYQALAVHFYPEVLLKIYENKLPDFLKVKESSETNMAKLNSDALIHKYIESILFYFKTRIW